MEGSTWSTTPDEHQRPMLVIQTSPPVVPHRNAYRAQAQPLPPMDENEVPTMGPIFKRWS